MPLFRSSGAANSSAAEVSLSSSASPPPVFISTSHPSFRSIPSTSSEKSDSSHLSSPHHSQSRSSPVNAGESRGSVSVSISSPEEAHENSEKKENSNEMKPTRKSFSSNQIQSPSASSSISQSQIPHSSPPVPDRSNIFFLEPVIYSSALHGHLYPDSEFFDDRNFLAELSSFSHIVEIRVWSREFIHGIQILYEVEEPIGPDQKPAKSKKIKLIETPRYLGKIHTDEYRMKVNHRAGEFVIGIEGTYKEWIESLTIVTNKHKHVFGQINSNPAYKVRSFICDVPMGHRVVGFHGFHGIHLHSIGVFHQPVSREDLKYKSSQDKCVMKKILSYFR